jgi:hypothetical protein
MHNWQCTLTADSHCHRAAICGDQTGRPPADLVLSLDGTGGAHQGAGDHHAVIAVSLGPQGTVAAANGLKRTA